MPIMDIDGTQVAYKDAGTGLPMVFIPGLAGSKEWFMYQHSGLRESYRVISYDLRTARGSAAHSLELLTNDLARLLTALKLQSAIIVGASFGGMIAQHFAATYRDRTDALVLISAFPQLQKQPRQTLIEWMFPGEVRIESPVQSLLRRLFPKKASGAAQETEGTGWLAAHSPRIPRATLDARVSLVQGFDSTPWMGRIEAPTLVIVGAADRPTFLSATQALYEGISDSALEVIESGDHFCFYTHHDLVNTAIDDFATERIKRL